MLHCDLVDDVDWVNEDPARRDAILRIWEEIERGMDEIPQDPVTKH